MERLDKFVANASKYSRSDVKNLIKKGKIFVNGELVKSGDIKISDSDCVTVDGVVISSLRSLYYMLNKPMNVISATEDDTHKTVIDIFPDDFKHRLFPVGRLDIDTVGLLIMTDDGELSHRLTSPKKDLFKKYYAQATGKLDMSYADIFANGIKFKDFTSKPAQIDILSNTSDEYEVIVEISEGKFHQVKRMLHAVGLEVNYLKRISIGELELDASLPEGGFRELSLAEINYLKSI